MYVKRYENEVAISVLHSHALQWEWIITGYSRDTDAILLQGVEGRRMDPNIGLGRYLFCRHPSYLFYGKMFSAGRGYVVCDQTEVERLFTSLLPRPKDAGRNILAFYQCPGEVITLLQCQAYTLLLQEGVA